jgi:hypothetical protein
MSDINAGMWKEFVEKFVSEANLEGKVLLIMRDNCTTCKKGGVS